MKNIKNNIIDNFTGLIERIVNGKVVDIYELFPFLSLESISDRRFINEQLAKAYYILDTDDSIVKARDCIRKAWLLSKYSDENILDIYVKIHNKIGDISSIKNAYKRTGIHFANLNDISTALKYFNLWHYAFANFEKKDLYDYDIDILNAIEKMAAPFSFTPQKPEFNDGKIRTAYLVKGILEPNSVLVKINSVLAKYHDKEKFEILFYIPESEETCKKSVVALQNIALLKKNKCKIFFADESKNDTSRILSLANKIYNDNPHILIYSAALSFFEHYFISVLKPASLQICLNQGPVAQFTWFNFDFAISWFYTNVTECPIDTTCVPLEFDLDYIEKHKTKDKSELGIPSDATIMVSAGRSVKFQNIDFWNTVSSLLEKHPNLFYVVIGLSLEQVPIIRNSVNSELLKKIKFFPWSRNYLDYLSVADFVLDSYPTGGGVVMIDSMALGKPILSFQHDFIRINDGSFGSAGSEVLAIPELLIERDNFKMLEEKAELLITDIQKRDKFGKLCKDTIYNNRGNAKRMTLRCEGIYEKLIEGKLKESIPKYFSSEDNVLKTIEFEKNFLETESFNTWQKAYENGYNSSMGNHIDYFYNTYLLEIGLYKDLEKARKVVEYAPGNASFMKVFIEMFPEKEFNLIDISEKNLTNVKAKLKKYSNVNYFLNYPEVTELENIDVVFSFLLSQSMPKTIWISHLKTVFNMLNVGGAYFFQFAYHPEGFADDQIQNGIYGNNKYKPEEIYKMLEKAGYSGCDISDPITLEKLNSDIVWYICRAY